MTVNNTLFPTQASEERNGKPGTAHVHPWTENGGPSGKVGIGRWREAHFEPLDCRVSGQNPRLANSSLSLNHFELIYLLTTTEWDNFPGGSDGKASTCNTETWVRSLGWEDLLEKEMAALSSIVAWESPWMKDPGGLQSMGSQRVRHDGATSLHFSSLNQTWNMSLSCKSWWGEKTVPGYVWQENSLWVRRVCEGFTLRRIQPFSQILKGGEDLECQKGPWCEYIFLLQLHIPRLCWMSSLSIDTVNKCVLFIYPWLGWSLLPHVGFSLVVESSSYSLLHFTCFSLLWLLSSWSMGSRAHRLQGLRRSGLVAPWLVGLPRPGTKPTSPALAGPLDHREVPIDPLMLLFLRILYLDDFSSCLVALGSTNAQNFWLPSVLLWFLNAFLLPRCDFWILAHIYNWQQFSPF